MKPISPADYRDVTKTDFLPSVQEFNEFVTARDGLAVLVKKLLTLWFEKVDIKSMEDKSAALAPYSKLFNLLDAKEWIDKVDAFVHMQVIMTDLITDNDNLRLHVVMYCMQEWFTEDSIGKAFGGLDGE